MATTKALELAQLADSVTVNANGEITNIGTLSTLGISGDISTSTLSATTSATAPFFNANTIATGYQLNGTTVLNYSGGNVVLGDLGAGVVLHYNGNNKLATTNTGVTVGGTTETTNLLVTGTGSSAAVFRNSVAPYLTFEETPDANTTNSFYMGVDGNNWWVRGDGLGGSDALRVVGGTSNVSVGGDLTVGGNFTVSGTTTTVNTDNLNIEDLNITLANGSANSSVADGAGITIDGAGATLTYNAIYNSWAFNKELRLLNNNGLFWDIAAGGASLGLKADANDNITFRNNGNWDRLVVANTGKIGVNTASPDALLHVSATSPHIDIGPQGGNRGKIGYHDLDVIIGSTSSTGEIIFKNNIGSTDAPQTSGDTKLKIHDVGMTLYSDTYNILDIATDTNDDQTSTDGILKITNGASHTTKAEFRWDESEDLVHVSYGDHGRHISINSSGLVGVGTGSSSPAHKLDVDGDINAQSSFRTDEVRHNIRPAINLNFVNSKRLDPRVTFSRSSSATYYDGKTKVKAEENLIGNSRYIGGSGWNLGAYTVTQDAGTAPDGTNTATKAAPNASGAGTSIAIGTNVSKTSATYTWSVYAKIDHADYPAISLYWNSSGSANARFNLSNGTVSSTNNGTGTMTASIEDAGNGWYRCISTYTGSTSTQATIYVLDSTSSSDWSLDNNPDGVKGILLWGPQIEVRDSATIYTETTTQPIRKYMNALVTASSNIPRFDHDMFTGESKGLLIETSATNLNINSEALTNWGYSLNVTYQADASIAPDGTKTADLVYGNTTNGQHYFGIPSGFSAGTGSETFSVFLKPVGNVHKLRLYLANQAGPYSQVFDFTNGTMSTSGSGNLGQTMEYYGNGWWRCSFSWTATKTNPYPTLVFLDENDSNSFAMDGYSGVLVWGAQWESGKFPTSYIPTSGSTASRNPDYAKLTNIFDFFNTNEGTFYVDQYMPMDYSTDPNTRYPLQVQGSTILVIYKNSNSATINTYDGATTVNRTPTTPGRNKIIMGYSLSEAEKSITINGSNSANALNGLNWRDFETNNEIVFGQENNNHGHIRKIAYYPQYLSTAEKIALTEE